MGENEENHYRFVEYPLNKNILYSAITALSMCSDISFKGLSDHLLKVTQVQVCGMHLILNYTHYGKIQPL